MVQDLATQWIQLYPCKNKNFRKRKRAYKSSWSRTGNQKSFTLTIPWTFGKSCEELSWNHCTSLPHRSETNGIAERAVRRVKEGTSAVLFSMEWNCYLRNIQDLLSDGKSPYERRFGEPFNGAVTPFGAMLEYHPISAKDISRLHQFGPKVLPGIFFGYALNAV